MLPGNIRIKVEPGTSATSKLKMMSSNIAAMKIEANCTSERLTSLKIPRDLKLTSSSSSTSNRSHKVFKPNLNVTRNKRNETAGGPASANSRGRGRGADRARGGRRGRNNAQNLVQSHGVFSEGVAEALRRNTHVSDRCADVRDSDASKLMEKPTINKNREWKIDKEHEEAVLKELLDDHVDPEHEIVNDLFPIQLPISEGGKFCVGNPDDVTSLVAGNKIKEEQKQDDAYQGNNPPELETPCALFDVKERLVLFQFPDTLPLPGVAPDAKQQPPPSVAAEDAEATDTQTDGKQQSGQGQRCSLKELREGLLGNIVVYKSGKVFLTIGNNNFNVEVGPEPGFLQDVMSVPVNVHTRSGDMITLGSLEGNVVLSPQWDQLVSHACLL